MRIGEASTDYATLQKKEQFTGIQTRLFQLLSQVGICSG
jgi:hypothetical protein